MLSSNRCTMKVATATATMAGPSRLMFPVICATSSIVATGARAIAPNSAIIPTTTNGAGSGPTPAPTGSSSRHTARPVNAPITSPGPKTPPDPPVPIDSDVARIFAKGSAMTMISGRLSSRPLRPSWIQPTPVASTCGRASAMRPTQAAPTAGRSFLVNGSRLLSAVSP